MKNLTFFIHRFIKRSLGVVGSIGGLFAILIASGLTNSRAQNTWTQKADFGGGNRYHAVGFSIGSKGYIGTGYDGISGYKKDFWEYDPVNDTWTQKANFGGGGRWWAVGFSIGSKGYIGTGFDGIAPYKNDFWEYDPATNTWTQKADFGGTVRILALGFSIGNKGYIGTGQRDDYTTVKSDFWEYDPVTNAWTQKADFGAGGVIEAVAFSIGGKGYVGTGFFNVGFYQNEFWEYDPASNSWTEKADFGGAGRAFSVGFSIGSKGYIGTGGDSYNTFNDFWEYDPATDIWTEKTLFGGTARSSSVGFSIGSKGYIGIGRGSDFIVKHDFWEYTPVCNGLTVYADIDGDGYGDAADTLFAANCIAPGGYVYNNTDCNDANASVHPGVFVVDICNAIDDNCDGNIDESCGNTITTGSISGSPLCPEAIVNVPFTSSGTFVSGNVYTAEISDKNGNFAAPASIGIFTSTANSGTITATLPPKPDGGTNYRIRITSTIPPVTGTQNDASLELISCNKVTALFVTGITNNAATLNWTGVPCADQYKIQYRTQGSTPWTSLYATTDSYTITGLGENTTYEYHVSTLCTASGSSDSKYTDIQTFTTGSCDGLIVFADADGDGYGDANNSLLEEDCIVPTGYVTDNNDCDDANAGVHPNATEICNNIDDNCNGVTDEGCGESCAIPIGLTANNITSSSAKLKWNAAASAKRYKLHYRITGSHTWTTITNISSTSRSISGLSAGTSYTCEVKSVCSANPIVSSGWSSSQTFTTASLRMGDESLQQISFQIYPNPAEGHVTIQFTLPYSTHVYIKVYAVSGRQVALLLNEDLQQGDHSLSMNTDHFPKGVYMVQLISDTGIGNQKLIVQ